MSPMGTSRSMASTRPNYGIDAPGVIRTMAIIGGVAIVLSITRFDLHMGTAIIDHHTWYGFAVSFTLTAVLMLLYSKIGKFSHRDRMLQRINWRGRRACSRRRHRARASAGRRCQAAHHGTSRGGGHLEYKRLKRQFAGTHRAKPWPRRRG